MGRALAGVLAFGIGVGSVAGYAVYERLNRNITVVDLPAATSVSRPARVAKTVQLPDGPSGPLNILLLGSDTRTGAGNHVGGVSAGLSDTAMVVHVAADRTWAWAVSIPRDTMVVRPACARKDGNGTDTGGLSMFNAAYAVGGPACTVATVEAATQIRIDHFAVIDFAGFKSMVDAVGGVKICVPKDVNDTIGDITLRKGTYTADGATALKYVRERHVLSANGDLGRVKRQQAFLAALGAKATSAGTLSNPARLYAFLDASTKSLTTDRDLGSLTALAGIGAEVNKVGISRVKFSTAPVQPYPADTNRVEFAPAAQDVWAALRTDTRPVKSSTSPSHSTSPSTSSATPTVSASSGAAAGSDGSSARPTGPARSLEAVENGLC